ncbi:helix-turn-helix domain-containing protein [Fulvivirga ligni]|uniref:helix-turn-helix domain-containing protein n=1 Tax=Fulvivirga ligni TaxID=2904246 RepID=UPI001F25BDEB|nr:helix-turn-helix domain-containing protein [Fulvivirga ligni]UII24291.1 helix-turn-helix domain-containing protein [Fulvivirga ligni]
MASKHQYPGPELTSALKLRGFKVSRNTLSKSKISAFGRRYFYLILLSKGNSKLHFDDHVVHMNGVYLVLINPKVPYATEILEDNHQGYSCVFTDVFMKPMERMQSLRSSPLFQVASPPAYKLNAHQEAAITDIFESMLRHENTDYLYKDDLMRNYIQMIVHEALHINPTDNFRKYSTSALRITTQFTDLLESQFPIEDLHMSVRLKSAQDYADILSIHVNYLNRTVKEITGKSTTQLISERLIAEAITLLRHTDWSVANIAYALGYEYPNYFSNFFKKMTGSTPKQFRL